MRITCLRVQRDDMLTHKERIQNQSMNISRESRKDMIFKNPSRFLPKKFSFRNINQKKISIILFPIALWQEHTHGRVLFNRQCPTLPAFHHHKSHFPTVQITNTKCLRDDRHRIARSSCFLRACLKKWRVI